MDGADALQGMKGNTSSSLWSDYPADDDLAEQRSVGNVAGRSAAHDRQQDQADKDDDGGGWTVVRHKKWNKRKSRQ